MKKLGLSHRPTFRKNYPQPAIEAGLIERTLPDKPKKQPATLTAPPEELIVVGQARSREDRLHGISGGLH